MACLDSCVSPPPLSPINLGLSQAPVNACLTPSTGSLQRAMPQQQLPLSHVTTNTKINSEHIKDCKESRGQGEHHGVGGDHDSLGMIPKPQASKENGKIPVFNPSKDTIKGVKTWAGECDPVDRVLPSEQEGPYLYSPHLESKGREITVSSRPAGAAQ